jgi:hypothetical protein
VLAHAEIVIAAPNDDWPRNALGKERGMRVIATFAHNVREHAIPALAPQTGKGVAKSVQVRKRHDYNLLRRVPHPTAQASHRHGQYSNRGATAYAICHTAWGLSE